MIGLDVGTTGVKAVAVTPTGEVVARAEVGYPLSTPRPGWSEQDPEAWWRASEAALAKLGVENAAGIGLSGQMHGLVCLDRDLRVLRPAILWNDQRTGAECAEIEERVGLERLIRLTGNRALTGFTAPKLLWLRRHEPDLYARIAYVLLPKDYVRLRLCGERAIDVADASGTLLFDVAGRRWSDEVIGALELDRAWLPPVLESPEVSGRTADGIPVAAGAGDQAAGALGVGVDRPGPLSVQIGTSGVVFAALPAFQADPQARVHSFCHAVPGCWHAMGVMLSAAGSLAWLRDAAAPGADFAGLASEAERWEPGAEGLTFLPYLEAPANPIRIPPERWGRREPRRPRSGTPSSPPMLPFVRQALVGLDRKEKAVRRFVGPALHQAHRRNAVVGRVDLDRGKLTGIEGQLLAGGQPGGIEGADPILVRKA